MARYGIGTRVEGAYDAVKSSVTEALKGEGFGILSEIDVRNTLKQKIGAEIERYEILGACNPQLANQALDTDRSIGLLLPCNVVLREVEGGVEVIILDPEVMFEVADAGTRAALADLAGEARERLVRVVDSLA